MTAETGSQGEVRQLARNQVRPEKFAGILYPECLAPVEFTDYTLIVSNV